MGIDVTMIRFDVTSLALMGGIDEVFGGDGHWFDVWNWCDVWGWLFELWPWFDF
jgi:hypothetical protein